MSFFKSFFGQDGEGARKRAEAYMESGHWGEARLELNKAIQCLKEAHDPRRIELEAKLKEVTRFLAEDHECEGDHLLDAGLFEEAGDRYHLALSLFEMEQDRERVEKKLSRETVQSPSEVTRFFLDEGSPETQGASEKSQNPFEGDPLDYFEVLANTLDPDLADEYRSLGEDFARGYAHMNHGDFPRAIEHYEKALQHHPDHRRIHQELGRALLFHGQTDRAIQELSLAKAGFPDDLDIIHLLSSAYLEHQNPQAALKLLEEAHKQSPNEIETCLLTGDTYVAMGELGKAKEAYRKALETDSEFAEIHSRLGKVAVMQEETSQAIEHYSEAVEHGTHVQDMVTLADLFLQDERDPESVLGLLNKALYYDPHKRWFYLVRIGEVYLKKGWEEKAREVLTQAREIIPENHTETLQKVDEFLGRV